MDEYTQRFRLVANQLFRLYDDDGIYIAYQPIYGFGKGHCHAGIINKYIVTYRTVTELAHLKFTSLLDVGAGEGYKASLIKRLFNVKVKCSDISEEACRRAEEIFGLEAIPADVQNLPFRNDEFDIVLCSDTLQEVHDLQKAIAELLRVGARAVVISVPHNLPVHDWYVHSFELNSFDFLKPEGYKVISKKMFSSLSGIPALYIERAVQRPLAITGARHQNISGNICNNVLRIPSKGFGKHSTTLITQLDSMACKLAIGFHAILFIILKDNSAYMTRGSQNVSARQILDFAVPYHYAKRNDLH